MPWLSFFLRGVRRQARDSEERTVRLVELQHHMRNELLDEGRPNSVVRLAEQLFSIPVVTAARVESMIGVTRPTARPRSTHSSSEVISSRPPAASATGCMRRRASSTRCTAPSTFPRVMSHRSSHSGSTRDARRGVSAFLALRLALSWRHEAGSATIRRKRTAPDLLQRIRQQQTDPSERLRIRRLGVRIPPSALAKVLVTAARSQRFGAEAT